MPTLASSSQVEIHYTKEMVFGVTPPAGAKNLRVTGESLDYSLEKHYSKSLHRSRTSAKSKSLKSTAGGGVTSELSYGDYDILLAALLQDAWSVYGVNGEQSVPVSVIATATELTSTTLTAGVDAWDNLQKGQWFRLYQPLSPNDGKLFKVSSATSSVITLDQATPAVPYAETEGAAVRTSRLTHGNTQSSFTVERQATDIGQYMAYRGMTPDKLTLDMQSGAISTVSLEFVGKDVIRGNTSVVPSGSDVPLNYGLQTGASSKDCVIWEGDQPLEGTYVKSLNFSFSNSLRTQGSAYHLDAVGIAAGTIDIQLSMSVYFADGDLFDKFKRSDKTSIVFSSFDSQGNGYVFTLPAACISSWKTAADGRDQDMLVKLSFTGLRDADNESEGLRKALFIDRVGSPEVIAPVLDDWWEYFFMPFY